MGAEEVIPIPDGTAAKAALLRERLRALPALWVAYSGGADSAYLLHEAWEALRPLGREVRGVIADSASLPRAELNAALALAAERGWAVDRIETGELDDPRYAANPVNRCYFCKATLFSEMEMHVRSLRRAAGVIHLAYGENADDAGDFRPGRQAADEFRVLSPLREAGLAKAEVRALSRAAGLPTADKVAMPCLSSRLPTGRPVTREALAQVEAGEERLRAAGFRVVRLRHLGETAKVQLGPDDLPRLDDAVRAALEKEISALGFARVEFDPQPYQGAALR